MRPSHTTCSNDFSRNAPRPEHDFDLLLHHYWISPTLCITTRYKFSRCEGLNAAARYPLLTFLAQICTLPLAMYTTCDACEPFTLRVCAVKTLIAQAARLYCTYYTRAAPFVASREMGACELCILKCNSHLYNRLARRRRLPLSF